MIHLNSYHLFEAATPNELTQEQEEFLDSGCGGRYWTLNQETGMVELKVHFYATNKGITDLLGIKFQTAYKDFLISNNSLKTLEGCPKYVGGRFVCSDNELESLEGGPIRVEGSYYCSRNNLKTLNGCAQKIEGSFDCSGNELESLEGGPSFVYSEYNCSNNRIVSLEGLGAVGSPYFKCSGNPVPEKILERIAFYMNHYHTRSYKTAVKNIWHNLSAEERAEVYLPEFDWVSPEEVRKIQLIKKYIKVKDFI